MCVKVVSHCRKHCFDSFRVCQQTTFDKFANNVLCSEIPPLDCFQKQLYQLSEALNFVFLPVIKTKKRFHLRLTSAFRHKNPKKNGFVIESTKFWDVYPACSRKCLYAIWSFEKTFISQSQNVVQNTGDYVRDHRRSLPG